MNVTGLGTAAVDAIEAVGPELIAVGGAIILLASIALGVRWIKASFF